MVVNEEEDLELKSEGGRRWRKRCLSFETRKPWKTKKPEAG